MERGGDEDWISFHQQEDLTTRLHNILEEYPPGIGIFKEFLQVCMLPLSLKQYGQASS